MKVSKHVLLALASLRATKGADALVDADGLWRAARQFELGEAELTEIAYAIEQDAPSETFHVESMSELDRVLTYALATWLAHIAVVRPATSGPTYHTLRGARALLTLGEGLCLSLGARKSAAAATYEIASLPDATRPEPYDFKSVVGRLAKVVSELSASA